MKKSDFLYSKLYIFALDLGRLHPMLDPIEFLDEWYKDANQFGSRFAVHCRYELEGAIRLASKNNPDLYSYDVHREKILKWFCGFFDFVDVDIWTLWIENNLSEARPSVQLRAIALVLIYNMVNVHDVEFNWDAHAKKFGWTSGQKLKEYYGDFIKDREEKKKFSLKYEEQIIPGLKGDNARKEFEAVIKEAKLNYR